MGAKPRTALALVGSVAATAIVFAIGPADAHLLGADSVSGGRICWVDSTKYDGPRRFAIRTWDRLGAIRIRRGGDACPSDLVFDDYRQTTTALRAYWSPRRGADRIGFNKYHLEQSTRQDKRSTAAHEVGHALGLDHSFHPNVMDVPCCRRANRPQRHDRRDYRELWR